MKLSEMTPEQRERKRATARQYEAWRTIYRLYNKLCDQRGIPPRA